MLGLRGFAARGLERRYFARHGIRDALFKGAKWTAGAGLVLGGLVGVRASTDEGSKRSVLFWSKVLPIYGHYRWTQLLSENGILNEEESEKAFEDLHTMYSPVIEKATLELRGFYLKAAQMVSTVDFFLPEQYMRWCKELQDQVPTPLAPGQAREIIEKSLGRSVEEVFDEFEEEPCGSASIGQVHRAKLKGTDCKVAIKVQAPDIEKKFRSDIKTITDFCRFAMPQHLKAMEEIEKQFETEFDYVGEAHNLELIYKNMMPLFGDVIAIPKPFMDLCTRDILVMEFLEGENLVRGAQNQLRRYAESIGRPYKEVEKEHLEEIRRGHLRDINSEASRLRRFQVLVDSKVQLINAGKWLYNHTLGTVLRQTLEYTPRFEILNLAEIIRTVALIHAHQIMKDGVFNCDPHPGNIVLMPDGRLGLIDYGQCKRISDESRFLYAQLVVALSEDDSEKVVDIMRRAGYKSKYNKDFFLFKIGQFWHDRYTADVLEGKNIQTFMEWCEAEDPIMDLPSDFVFPGRVSVLLRGIGNYFGLETSMAKLWRPVALDVLAERQH